MLLTHGIISPDSLAPVETSFPGQRSTLESKLRITAGCMQHSPVLWTLRIQLEPTPLLVERSLVPGTSTKVSPGGGDVRETIATISLHSCSVPFVMGAGNHATFESCSGPPAIWKIYDYFFNLILILIKAIHVHNFKSQMVPQGF